VSDHPDKEAQIHGWPRLFSLQSKQFSSQCYWRIK